MTEATLHALHIHLRGKEDAHYEMTDMDVNHMLDLRPKVEDLIDNVNIVCNVLSIVADGVWITGHR